MSISRIKNKYLRRFVIIIAILPVFSIGIPLAGVLAAWEALKETPEAVCNAWIGH